MPAALTHLRLERPSARRRPPGARQPVPAQRDVGRHDRVLGARLDELAADTGPPGRGRHRRGSAFCSGGNPAWIAGEPDAEVDYLRTRMIAFYRAWLSIRRLEVPTIAALNGHAVGAGLCLALACDLRYAAAGARLRVPFVKLGMNPGMAATYLLPDVVGDAAPATCCSPAAPSRPRRRPPSAW